MSEGECFMNRIRKFTGMLAAGMALLPALTIVRAEEPVQLQSPYELKFNETGAKGSSLADLTVDAMHWYSKAGSGYKNASYSFAGDELFIGSLPEGTWTDADLEAALSDTKVLEIKIKGRYLVEGLENCIRDAIEKDGPFVTPQGMKFIINPDQPGLAPDERYHERTAFLEKIVLKDNTRFDQTREYRVMMDAATFHSQAKFTENAAMLVDEAEAVTVREVVKAFVEKDMGGRVIENYANPLGDGRVRVTSAAELTYDEENDLYHYTVTRAFESEDGNCWIAVPEDLLKRKLQGIIGNSLYRGSFYTSVNGGEELTGDASRYHVLVPVDQKSGTFTLKYHELVGSTGNILIIVSTAAMMGIVVLVMMFSGKKKK